MRGPLVITAVALAVAAPAQAAPPHDAAPVDERVVTMPGRLFAPGIVTLLVGETVVWRNADNAAHTVSADDDSFESPRLAPGAEFAHRFERPGRFSYHCTVHRFMRGRVEVAGIALTGPDRPLRLGGRATLAGRAPAGARTVTFERLPAAGGSQPVAVAEPDGTGRFAFTVTADAPARYRVRAGELSSLVVPVAVAPEVRLAARRRAGAVSVRIHIPGQAGARVVLERHERERFGFVRLRAVTLDRDGRSHQVLRTGRRLRLRARVAVPVGGFSRAFGEEVVVPRRGAVRRGGAHH